MAAHSSVLAWRIPGMEEPGGLQSVHGVAVSDTTERLHFHFSLSCIGEGNGSPLQRSCLENPRDGGACWAAIYGVAQSRTRLKRLSSSSSRYCRTHVKWLCSSRNLIETLAHVRRHLQGISAFSSRLSCNVMHVFRVQMLPSLP